METMKGERRGDFITSLRACASHRVDTRRLKENDEVSYSDELPQLKTMETKGGGGDFHVAKIDHDDDDVERERRARGPTE